VLPGDPTAKPFASQDSAVRVVNPALRTDVQAGKACTQPRVVSAERVCDESPRDVFHGPTASGLRPGKTKEAAMNISRKLGVLIAVIAAFAFPAWALADHGSGGHGSDDGQQQTQTTQTNGGPVNDANENQAADDNGADQTPQTDQSTTPTATPPPAAPSRTETYELRGTVVSVDPATDQVTLKIGKTNHGGRGHALRGQTLTFDLTNARLKVRDNNNDGMRDLNDVAAGDRGEVRARLARPLPSSFSGPIAAQRFEDKTHS
jgi:hypothetical protein